VSVRRPRGRGSLAARAPADHSPARAATGGDTDRTGARAILPTGCHRRQGTSHGAPSGATAPFRAVGSDDARREHPLRHSAPGCPGGQFGIGRRFRCHRAARPGSGRSAVTIATPARTPHRDLPGVVVTSRGTTGRGYRTLAAPPGRELAAAPRDLFARIRARFGCPPHQASTLADDHGDQGHRSAAPPRVASSATTTSTIPARVWAWLRRA
jgi:hypothetical protein